MVKAISQMALVYRKGGINFYNCPGCLESAGLSRLIDHRFETLEDCICRLFDVSRHNLKSKRRKRGMIYARHLFRYILSIDFNFRKFEIAKVSGCYRKSNNSRIIDNSINEAANLIETDKEYRAKYEYIKNKIEKKLIIIPVKPRE